MMKTNLAPVINEWTNRTLKDAAARKPGTEGIFLLKKKK